MTTTPAGAVDYTTKIPNNVNLADDQRVLKALEQWHPGYIDWWMTMGPDGFQTSRRVSAHRHLDRPEGLGEIRLCENAGIPLGHSAGAAGRKTRQVNFGAHKGEKAWQEVPGEYRAMLRRLDRHPGRYRTRLRRAAALPRQNRAVAL